MRFGNNSGGKLFVRRRSNDFAKTYGDGSQGAP